MRRWAFLAVVLVFLATFLTGCWSRREINELAIISSVGIDKEGDTWRLTAEIFRPPSGGGEGGGGGSSGQQRQVWIALGEGYTVFQAVRDMAMKVPRRPYFAHCTAVIVGEEAARAGITEVLDFWDRDAEARRNTNILVARGRAEDIIVGSQGGLEKTAGLEVVGLKRTARADAHSRIFTIHEFLVDLAAPGADPLTAQVELKTAPAPRGFVSGGGGWDGQSGGERTTGGSAGGSQGVQMLRLKGLALFRKEKLAGFFEPAEARGLLWVRGDIASTIINVPGPSSGNERKSQVALELFRANKQLEVKAKEGKPEVTVKVRVELGLANQGYPGDLTRPEPTLSMERQAATVIKNEIEAAAEKAKSIGIDPFAFGEAIHRQQPKLWRELEKDWPQGLQDLSVKVECSAKIRRSGLSTKAPQEKP